MGKAKTAALYVVITVDTESSDSPQAITRKDLLNSMIHGKVQNSYWGFPKILDILDQHKCKATFFISVLEHKKYGEAALRQVCTEIRQRGQDIQLHIHPVWAYGRRFMDEYSREEQIGIIKEGKDLLERWAGESPIAYRGGAYYSLNEDTFKALEANGLAVDSSMFYSQPHCHFAITKNKVIEVNRIVELPVTICQLQQELTLGPLRYRRQPYYDKTDLNRLTLDQLLWFVKEAMDHDLRVMTFFLHSWSFLKSDSSLNDFRPNHEEMKKFDEFLSVATKDPRIEIITVKQFYDLYRRNPEVFIGSSNYVPRLKLRINPTRVIPGAYRLLRARIVKH